MADQLSRLDVSATATDNASPALNSVTKALNAQTAAVVENAAQFDVRDEKVTRSTQSTTQLVNKYNALERAQSSLTKATREGNAAIAALGDDLQAGVITQEQYNGAVVGVSQRLDALRQRVLAARAAQSAMDGTVSSLADSAQRAAQRIQDLVEANSRASAGQNIANRFSGFTDRSDKFAAGIAYDARASDLAAYGQELDRVRAKYDEVFASAQRYEAALHEISRAEATGAVSSNLAADARYRLAEANGNSTLNFINQRTGVTGGTAVGSRASDVAAYGQELDRVRAKYDEVFAASKRYEVELDAINAAERAGAISSNIATSARERAAVLLTGLSSTAAGARQSFGNLGQMVQQAGYQFNDFFVQVGSGQSALTAFSQQGSQLLGMFGPAGAVASIVLAVGAIAAQFALGKTESDKLTAALKTQNTMYEAALQASQSYAEGLDAEQKKVRELTNYYESLTTARQAYAQRQITKSKDDLSTRQTSLYNSAVSATMPLQASAKGYTGSVDDYGQPVMTAVTQAANDAGAAIQQFKDSGDKSSEALLGLVQRLSDVAQTADGPTKSAINNVVKALDPLASQLTDLDEKLGQNAKMASALGASYGAAAGGIASFAYQITNMVAAAGKVAAAVNTPLSGLTTKAGDQAALQSALKNGGLAGYQKELNRQNDASSVQKYVSDAQADLGKTLKSQGYSTDQITSIQAQQLPQMQAAAQRIVDINRSNDDLRQKLQDASRDAKRGATAAEKEAQALMASYSGVYQMDPDTGLLFDNATEQKVAQRIKNQIDEYRKNSSRLFEGQSGETASLNLRLANPSGGDQLNQMIAEAQARTTAAQRGLNPQDTDTYVKGAKDIASLTAQVKLQTQSYQELQEAGQSAFSSIFSEAARGTLTFKSLSSVLDTLLQQILKLGVTNPILNSLGLNGGSTLPTLGSVGSVISKLFGDSTVTTANLDSSSAFESDLYSGQRASGGPVTAGTTYLTGEEGPELFTPTTNGSIASAAATASSNPASDAASIAADTAARTAAATSGNGLTVHVHTLPGTTAQATESTGPNGQRQLQIMMQQVKQSIASDISRGGTSLNKSIESRYGVSSAAGIQR